MMVDCESLGTKPRMQTRREFLRNAAGFALAAALPARAEAGAWVNDTHSQLNRTHVRELLTPTTVEELIAIVRQAARRNLPISVSGCRHSMGGQQFATDSLCIDCRRLSRVISFDFDSGLIQAEGGIQWPQLIDEYLARQRGREKQWGIAQKQTGADSFTLGGSLSSNIHGRGLTMPPLIANVESFELLKANGAIVHC